MTKNGHKARDVHHYQQSRSTIVGLLPVIITNYHTSTGTSIAYCDTIDSYTIDFAC